MKKVYRITFYGGYRDGEVAFQETAPIENIYCSDAISITLTEKEFDEIKGIENRSIKYFKYSPLHVKGERYKYVCQGII